MISATLTASLALPAVAAGMPKERLAALAVARAERVRDRIVELADVDAGRIAVHGRTGRGAPAVRVRLTAR